LQFTSWRRRLFEEATANWQAKNTAQIKRCFAPNLQCLKAKVN